MKVKGEEIYIFQAILNFLQFIRMEDHNKCKISAHSLQNDASIGQKNTGRPGYGGVNTTIAVIFP